MFIDKAGFYETSGGFSVLAVLFKLNFSLVSIDSVKKRFQFSGNRCNIWKRFRVYVRVWLTK